MPNPPFSNGVLQKATGAPQEFLKYAKPNYLVRDTDLFFSDYQIKK